MTTPLPVVILLSGAGGGFPDPNLFCSGRDHLARFETLGYPGWRHYVETGLSANKLIQYLVAQIAIRVPRGPIRIIGISIGGHFGYAAALELQACGRTIAGFCAIDTFTMSSAGPGAGWRRRALLRGLTLLHDRRLREFFRFLRSRFWRALLRLAGGRLPSLLRRYTSSARLPWFLSVDPIFEEELNMRLLIQQAAPWILALDREPVALTAPAVLLRTRHFGADDAVWHRRCPGIRIVEIPGDHQTLFDPANVDLFRETFAMATREWGGRRSD